MIHNYISISDRDPETPRVLVITQFFPPESMGGGHRWQQFANHNRDSFEFQILTTPPSYPFGDFERSYKPLETDTVDEIPVTRLWTFQPTSDAGNLSRILNYGIFAVLSTLYVILNFWRYDIIVTMSTPHTTFIGGAIGQLLGCQWVVDIFDLWLDYAADYGYVDRHSLAYHFVDLLETQAITNADEVVVLTETMGNYFAEKYSLSPERFTIVPFGVDETMFRQNNQEHSEEQLIYIGNFGTFYAFEPYLRAFARLDDDYEFYLVGWGERESELKALVDDLGIDDRVHFPGPVPREEIPDYLAASTVNLVPIITDWEYDFARPNKLIEGMAVGVPYIAPPLNEIEVVTEASKAGLTVENDPEQIAEAMRTLLEGGQKRTQMGHRAVDFINQEHRWSLLSDRINDVLSMPGENHK